MKIVTFLGLGTTIFAVYFLFFKVDFSKPWWDGNEYQKVCATTGDENCYTLVVSSDGENVIGFGMPNGGYLVGSDSECVKASQLKESRLCRMWDQSGDKWDIMKQ